MNWATLVYCKRQGKIEKVFLEDQCWRCLDWDKITWRSYRQADQFIISSDFWGLLSLINKFCPAIFTYLIWKKNKSDLWHNSPFFSLCWWKECLHTTSIMKASNVHCLYCLLSVLMLSWKWDLTEYTFHFLFNISLMHNHSSLNFAQNKMQTYNGTSLLAVEY